MFSVRCSVVLGRCQIPQFQLLLLSFSFSFSLISCQARWFKVGPQVLDLNIQQQSKGEVLRCCRVACCAVAIAQLHSHTVAFSVDLAFSGGGVAGVAGGFEVLAVSSLICRNYHTTNFAGEK